MKALEFIAGTVLSLVVLGSSYAAGAGEPGSAHGVVEATSKEVLLLIESSREYVDEDPERFFSQVEGLLSPVVDFDGFARGVMSKHYKDASPEQRTRFSDTFRTALVRTYALALTEFREGEVVVLEPNKPPQRPDRELVKMEIRLSPAEIYPVIYSMKRGGDAQWRGGNIIINGINIGLTYRNQFKSAVSNKAYDGDLDRVIEAWGKVVSASQEDAEAEPEGSGDRA